MFQEHRWRTTAKGHPIRNTSVSYRQWWTNGAGQHHQYLFRSTRWTLISIFRHCPVEGRQCTNSGRGRRYASQLLTRWSLHLEVALQALEAFETNYLSN